MGTSKIKQYLEMVLDLEARKLMTEEIIHSVEKHTFTADSLEPLEKEISAKKEEFKGSDHCTCSVVGACIGAGFGFFGMLSSGDVFGMFGMAAIFGFIGFLLGMMIDRIASPSLEKKEYETWRQEIVLRNQRIKEQNQEKEKRNNEKLRIARRKNELIAYSVKQLQQTRDSIDRTLQRLYSNNVIHPKYQELVALSYIYEYLDTGICSELEGINGAYRQYESDVRLDRISSQLGVIIRKLDTIALKMDHILYKMDRMHHAFVEFSGDMKSLMGGIQQTIDGVSAKIETQTKQLNEIGVNTAITAYTTQMIERNQYYERNWSNGRGLYDHVNVPKS